jgi:hypothetical protein
VLATLKELQLTRLDVLLTFVCAHVSALVIALSDSLRERIGKSETHPILKQDRSLVHV